MSVCCECCVLSGRGLCDELTTRPEESYWLVRRCVWYRNRVYGEPNINQLWLNFRDLLAGGDFITLVSLQVRLPASQPAHHLIEYLVLWLLSQNKKEMEVVPVRNIYLRNWHMSFKSDISIYSLKAVSTFFVPRQKAFTTLFCKYFFVSMTILKSLL